MAKWEYLVELVPWRLYTSEWLSILGNDGWELVHVHTVTPEYLCTFKRKVNQ